jgi:hypothetical protein
LGRGLAKKQHTAAAAQGATIEIGLQGFTRKSCKRQHDLRILSHRGFLYLVAISVLCISILQQWLARGDCNFMNNPGQVQGLKYAL